MKRIDGQENHIVFKDDFDLRLRERLPEQYRACLPFADDVAREITKLMWEPLDRVLGALRLATRITLEEEV